MTYGGFEDGAWQAATDPHFAEKRAHELCKRLWSDFTEGALDVEQLAWAAHVVWFKSIRPLWCLEPARWREIFEATGYCVDGKQADRPTDPVTLYRAAPTRKPQNALIWRMTKGQIRSGEYGWSWSADLDEAQEFARDRGRNHGPHRVWRITADPSAVLGRITINDEVIVDTSKLAKLPEQVRAERVSR